MAWLKKLFGPGQPAARTGPQGANDWLQQGNAALQAGELEAAARCYARAAEGDPLDPIPHLNAGFVALEQGDAAAALVHVEEALRRSPAGAALVADAWFLRGRALARQGQVDAALEAFSMALQARADFAEALEEGLPLLHAQRRFADALAWAERLQACRPSPAAALERAKALAALGRHAQALAVLDATIAENPGNAQAWTGRGHTLLALERADEALLAFRKALDLVGPEPAALANEAAALARAGRIDEAVLRYRELLQRAPAPQPAIDLIHLLIDQLRVREAREIGEQALRHFPQEADLHWAFSAACLLLGDLEQGWSEYEWRWQAASGTRPVLPDFGRPRWLGGEPLAGKTLLLAPEQGLGDTIQFLRYVPEVAARAGKVLLSVTGELHELATRAGFPANCVVVPPGGKVDGFDLHTSLMSLPLALGTGATIPAAVPYLRADPERTRAWRLRLQAHPGLKVGVAWSGNPGHANDHNRSIPLELFRSVETAGCTFVSLQPQVRASDAEALARWTGLLQWGEELRSFMDTASLMEALDLVVAVDTSVVHMAGALARPTRLLLPRVPDWRWMLDREDTPWYPTMRLYRQPARGDWAGAIARLRTELAQLASA